MSLDRKCPKCGSTEVQLMSEKSKHGFIWLLIFGMFWLFWVACKWVVGFMILICWDWWMAIIKKNQGKGYIYASKGWFSGQKRLYFCHKCHHNFRG